jgi:hypothetical protein
MKRILLSTACVLALAACQSAPGNLQAQLDAEKATNADLRTQLASVPSSSNGVTGTESLVPPNAKAGECYARITQPTKFKTVSEKVIATESSNSVSIIPATYKTVQERVLVREAIRASRSCACNLQNGSRTYPCDPGENHAEQSCTNLQNV